MRGPQVMKGYLNNDEATATTIDDDGWLHTGDVAVIDEHDHMSIVDRVKELIKYKGFQVPPAELEALLITHPKVADVAVIGVPDEEAGEVPKAFVVPMPGSDLTVDEVQALRRRARRQLQADPASSSSSTRSRSRRAARSCVACSATAERTERTHQRSTCADPVVSSRVLKVRQDAVDSTRDVPYSA